LKLDLNNRSRAPPGTTVFAAQGTNPETRCLPWKGNGTGPRISKREYPMNIATFPKTSTSSRRQSITGRDGYLVLQALAYAIEVIGAMPDQWQEWSNREDMKTLLAAWAEGWEAEHLREGVRHHLFHPGSPLSRNTAIDDPAA
jgi:hypothetical protein